MRFLRDVLVVSLGVFLGFVVVVHTHELIDIVHAFVQLQDFRADLYSAEAECLIHSARQTINWTPFTDLSFSLMVLSIACYLD